jgi:hypothetical protein
MLPGTGWGADLQLGLAGSAEYDTNVLRSSNDEKDDFVFRVIPKVSFIEDEGKFHWDLRYQMPWETAIETDRVQGLRHFLDVGANHHVNQRTQVFFDNSFRYSEAVSSVTELDEMGAPSVGTFREPVIRNNGTLGVQHGFTPRLTGNFAFSHRLFESEIRRRSDNMVYVGNTNLNYALSSRHKLGGGAAATYQDLEASTDGSIPPSQAFFLNIFGTWTWTIDETTSFQLTGGPAFVKNNQDAPPPVVERLVIPYAATTPLVSGFEVASCGEVNGVRVLEKCRVVREAANQAESDAIVNAGSQPLEFGPAGRPPSRSASSWDFFGEVALSKRWSPRLLSRFMYRRTESTASGAGSATLDLVSLTTNWQISELWDAGVRADFTRRESTAPTNQTFTVVQEATSDPGTINDAFAETVGLTSSKVTRALDTDRWGVAVRMSRRITKHMRASLRYTYNEQTSKDDTLGTSSDFSNHLVTLGVQYDFDRWHLW